MGNKKVTTPTLDETVEFWAQKLAATTDGSMDGWHFNMWIDAVATDITDAVTTRAAAIKATP